MFVAEKHKNKLFNAGKITKQTFNAPQNNKKSQFCEKAKLTFSVITKTKNVPVMAKKHKKCTCCGKKNTK
jgi:hypothetical protein